MRTAISLIPLLPILIGIICGIIINEYCYFYYITIPLLSSIVLYYRRQKTLAIIALSVALGWCCSHINSAKPIDNKFFNDKYIFTGTATSVKEKDAIRNIVVDIDIINDTSKSYDTPNFKCILSIPSQNPHISIGDRISYYGNIDKIIDDRDVPLEFNYATFYSRQGIHISSFVSPENIKIIGTDNSWKWEIRRFQEKITHIISSLPLSEQCIEFLNTTITGDISMLGYEQRLKFSTSGLAHILALSGLHVGIISLIIALFLFPLNIIGKRRLRYITSIILLWGYALITGLSPSVTRAVIMATIFITANILQRRHSPYNSLCFAAILILVFSPNSLYNIGFQLSFIAVASILLFAKKLNPINQRHRIIYTIFSIMCVSISAMIGTGIISAYYFHNFPIYFLISNAIATFIFPIVLFSGIISIFISALGINPSYMCIIVEFSYNILDWITSFITSLPGSYIDKIYLNYWTLTTYFLSIAFLYATLKFKRLVWAIAFLSTIIITVIINLISESNIPKCEYFIPRNSYYTNIIVKDSTNVYLISTAKGGDSIDAINMCNNKYKDYLGKIGLDSITPTNKYIETNRIFRQEKMLVIGSDAIKIISNNNDVYESNIKPKYALVCRGYKGDILNMYKVVSPDTIILSKDLHKKRINRYIDSCIKHNIPHISLTDKGFHRIISN